jgi:ELAV/HuD family splicing factor
MHSTSTSPYNQRTKCNLIVNYLPQSMKENDLNNLFGKMGTLRSCKLMFDRQTGYSFGYAFIEYEQETDAIRAVENLNGYQIEHKRLKVSFARPNNENTKNTNLYIRNLPTCYEETHIYELFSQYGEVVQVRLLRDQQTSSSKRIGFVIMSTKQMAERALHSLDGQIPPNSTEPIWVKFASEDDNRRSNINFGTNRKQQNQQQQQQLQQHQRQTIMNGFQRQQSIQNLGKIKRSLSQNRFNPIQVQSHMPTNYHYYSQQQHQQQHQQQSQMYDQVSNCGHSVYVYGIGPHTSETDLFNLFQSTGRSITSINVIKNQKNGLGKGYGFITYQNYEEACFAIQTMNGFIYQNRPLQVAFKTY